MKILNYFSILLVSFLLFFACNQASNEHETVSVKSEQYINGLKIIDQNCLSCHSPKTLDDGKIAPTLQEITQSYLTKDISENEFKKQMSHFLKAPNKEASRMKKAVEQYGIMPNLGFDVKQYKAVATYLYRANIDREGWFEEQFKKEKIQLLKYIETDSVNYLEKGRNIALSTKSVLGKNLLTALKTKETAKALSFCNTRAIHITDSMTVVQNAFIRRVSDKNRNPANEAKGYELEYIQHAKEEINASGSAKPKIIDKGNKVIGYYPIMTNNMCLQCHGDIKKNIDWRTRKKIALLYPEDKATGYGSNELRGIWVVEMQK